MRYKVNGLKEVYSPNLLEPTSPRCQVIVLVIMSRCMNFTVFSFVMVSNNKKKCLPYQSVKLLLLSNNINKHSPWMLSLKIFWSACAAADYRQIRCRPSIYRWQHPKTFSTNIITLHNSVQVNVKFYVRKKVFIYFIFYMLKTNGTELIDESVMFVYTFQAM